MLPETSVEILDDVLEDRGWSRRDGQVKMIKAIDKALKERRDLTVMAPVGTGKTGGYVIPAMRNKKAVIGTSTKALQDQIRGELEEFVADIEKRYSETITWKIVKGKSNYIHHTLLADYLYAARMGSHGSDWLEFQEVLESLLEEAKEAVSAKSGFDSEGILNRIPYSVKKHFIQSAVNDPYAARSLYFWARQEAMESDIIVMNTALFAAEVKNGGSIIVPPEGEDPEFGTILNRELIVFDEAHHARDIITGSYTIESPLREAIKIAGNHNLPATASLAEEALEHESKLVDDNGNGIIVKPRISRSEVRSYVSNVRKSFVAEDKDEEFPRFALIVRKLTEYEFGLIEKQNDFNKNGRPFSTPLFNVCTDDSGNIVLIPFNVKFFRSHIASAAGENVDPVVVMCSGTITSYDGRTIGIRKSDHLSVESPFDTSRMRLFIPDELKYTGNQLEHSAAALKRGVELVDLAKGDALVLTTTIARIDEYKHALQKLGYHVITGSVDKAAAVDEFKNTPGSVLVGTKSLWEGIDIPGDALRLVVIDKIMFPIQGDPVVKTRALYTRMTGEDDFTSNFVRPGANMMAQGVGRLIRSVDDFGGVAILDSRLANRRYGSSVMGLVDGNHLCTGDDDEFNRFIAGTIEGEILPPKRGMWRPLKI